MAYDMGHYEATMPSMLTPIPHIDNRRFARALYWMGWHITDIAEHLGEPRTTVQSWKGRDRWDDASVMRCMESATEARYVVLVLKEKKVGSDYKEIDLLGRQLERFARVRRYEAPGGHEGDLNPAIEARNAAPKRRSVRNHFTQEQAIHLRQSFLNSLYGYQRYWYNAGSERTRMILKSRQIGATWYFSREALLDAVETSRNQIFLSASKAQAHIFKQYIRQFARESCDVDLKGDPIVLSNGAHMYFLGMSARTAQGYHGNFYFDEFFWTYKFEELNKVASGMAMHKQWRKTYFSTPSAKSHQAYPYWTGDRFNRRRSKDERLEIDTSHAHLAAGMRSPDKVWRHIVTIEDAAAGGCDLFDIEDLRMEYAPDEFSNLLMCQFMDDGDSLFSLAAMQSCMVDTWVVWPELKPLEIRPYGHLPVWIGYDPKGDGTDSAGLVVIAPPRSPGGKFRIIERHRIANKDFESQNKFIRDVAKRFNVTYIGIDANGVGAAVYQLVQQWFPAARRFTYSPDVKAMLVMKALNVIGNGRLEFDAAWTDLAHSFMAIRKTLTPSGRQVTFHSGRSEEIGHADLAWACMHALINEPLEGQTSRNSSVLEIF